MKKLLLLVMLCIASILHGAETILIIESYHSDYQWDKDYIEGLKETLASDYTLTTFQMDTKRIPKTKFESQAQKAWEKYKEIKPVLVILGDDNAMKYLGAKFSKEKTPVVFLGINNNPRDYYDVTTTQNITGVLERPLYKRSIAQIKTIIKPAPKKILVLFDGGTTSQAAIAETFKKRKSISIAGITTDVKNIKTWEEWQKTVKSMKTDGYDAVVVGLYHTIVDASGKHIPAGDVLSWTMKNTPVPPFCLWSFSVGGAEKTIGGLVLYGKEQGIAAGKLVHQIMKGKSPHDIKPKIGKKGIMIFSRSQLSKYNLELPKSAKGKAKLLE